MQISEWWHPCSHRVPDENRKTTTHLDTHACIHGVNTVNPVPRVCRLLSAAIELDLGRRVPYQRDHNRARTALTHLTWTAQNSLISWPHPTYRGIYTLDPWPLLWTKRVPPGSEPAAHWFVFILCASFANRRHRLERFECVFALFSQPARVGAWPGTIRRQDPDRPTGPTGCTEDTLIDFGTF